ncbi:oxidoreductase [Legionella sp. W05-934-2]|uniref:oxidoreductase n=1 Tax=Legionella sp. W05-934-2 TaxID=1198649 RepID=UPI003461BDED
MLLNEKVIVVTGAARGIGLAIAKFAHQQGASIVLHDRPKSQLQSIAEQFADQVTYIEADLADEHNAERIINAAVETFGRINGLVNCAGIYPRSDIDTSRSLFDSVMAVNVKAPMLLSQHAVKHMKMQKQGGSIVNIGSINAHCGQPDLLVYSMSKGALMTMTRNLADALTTDGIRVNQLNVGWTATETEVALKQREGLGKDWQRRIPTLYAPRGQILKPEEIAPHVAFWLSDWSAPVSGAVYELEQYPVIGRNRICDISLS